MKRVWWKEKIIYQVYPRSFCDSNGDGVGDINGIIGKLDYLTDIGIDMIWLNPIYKSPNDDNGYDISGYKEIMPDFGTMEDFGRMLSEIHRRGMKLIMDLVLNHTSDEHPWFAESRSDRQNSKRNYYIWKKGKNGGPPNNWESIFGGSAWEYDEKTGEYYLHVFTKRQPDLNWDNPVVRKEIYGIVNWWISKGVDGFRIDAINIISKNGKFPDDRKIVKGKVRGSRFFINGKNVHWYLHDMYENTFAGHDVVTIGECGDTTVKDALNYTSRKKKELDMIFPFEHVVLDYGTDGKFDVKEIDMAEFWNTVVNWQQSLNGRSWNALYLTNHDQPRAISRYADDGDFRIESGKLLATMLLTLQGTPFIYQGEEIGMTNVKFSDINDYKDVEIHNYYKAALEKGIESECIMDGIYMHGRDNSRTPMQWDDTANSGFTNGSPWIRVNPNYREINVKKSVNEKKSILNYYKELISIRKKNICLIYGDFIPVRQKDKNIFSYLRILDKEKFLVILNFSNNIVKFIPDKKLKYDEAKIIVGNYNLDNGNMIDTLLPYEAKVLKLF